MNECLLFAYFLPQVQQRCTPKQFDDIMTRFLKGNLDVGLNEKCKVMKADFVVLDFRFLSMVTGKDMV
jgi:hypothetical protein